MENIIFSITLFLMYLWVLWLRQKMNFFEENLLKLQARIEKTEVDRLFETVK